jgi:hypothetical protein
MIDDQDNDRDEYVKQQIESGHRSPLATLQFVLQYLGRKHSTNEREGNIIEGAEGSVKTRNAKVKEEFFALLKGNYPNSLLKSFWADNVESEKAQKKKGGLFNWPKRDTETPSENTEEPKKKRGRKKKEEAGE